jgi:hypothetical protein
MRVRVRTAAMLALAIIAIAGVLGAACNDDGSGDETTAEEYFQRLDELNQRADEEISRLDDELGDAFDSESFTDDVRDALVRAYEELRDAFEDLLDDLRDTDPPEELDDEHDEAVEAFESVRDRFDEFIDGIQDADSVEDLGEAFGGGDPTDALVDACERLQEFADDHDIEVDLRCTAGSTP